jgi:hypothetical protein
MNGVAADAADLLLQQWRSADKPVELASLAWALQNEFGAEVSDDWFGFRTFKRFLRHAVPDGEISTGDQAVLLPDSGDDAPDVDRSSDADDAAAAVPAAATASVDGVPDAVVRLRSIDRGFPLIDTTQWGQVYAQLAAAWRRTGRGTPDTRMVNRLTRSARDSASATGEPVSRRHLDYVAKAVMAGSTTGEPMSAAAIGDAFAAWTLQRMADLRIVGATDAPRRTAIARWLLP